MNLKEKIQITIGGIYKYSLQPDDLRLLLKKRSRHIDSCLLLCVFVRPTAFTYRRHAEHQTDDKETKGHYPHTQVHTKTKVIIMQQTSIIILKKNDVIYFRFSWSS